MTHRELRNRPSHIKERSFFHECLKKSLSRKHVFPKNLRKCFKTVFNLKNKRFLQLYNNEMRKGSAVHEWDDSSVSVQSQQRGQLTIGVGERRHLGQTLGRELQSHLLVLLGEEHGLCGSCSVRQVLVSRPPSAPRTSATTTMTSLSQTTGIFSHHDWMKIFRTRRPLSTGIFSASTEPTSSSACVTRELSWCDTALSW